MDPDVRRMMADLGTAHRDFISAPHEGNSRAIERQEALALEDSRARRQRIVAGATNENDPQHKALKGWNTFDEQCAGDGFEDLQNRQDGQGHRAELSRRAAHQYDHQREMQENRFGEERRMYMQDRGGIQMPRGGYSAPQRAPRAPMATANPNRQRPPSPRSQGTVRFARGGAARQVPGRHMPTAPQPGAVPVINTQLATAVQAAAQTSATPATTTTTSANPIASSVPRKSPAVSAAGPARSASPALSVASSSSDSAVANVQARIKAKFFASQQTARLPTLSSSTSTEVAPRAAPNTPGLPPSTAIAQSSAAEFSTPVAKEAASVARPQATHSQAPSRLPPSTAAAQPSTATLSTPVANEEAPVARSQAPHNKTPAAINGVSAITNGTQAPTARVEEAQVTSARARATGPAIQTGASTNGDNNAAIPRARATETAPNGVTFKATAKTAVVRTRATNGVAFSPAAAAAPAAASPAATTPAPAPSASAVEVDEQRARLMKMLSDPGMKIRANASALARTPEEIAVAKKHYEEFPERYPVLFHVRKTLARDVAKLAVDGDKEAAEYYLKGKYPCRRWLFDAAVAIHSGGTPQDQNNPTVKEIVKALKAYPAGNGLNGDATQAKTQPAAADTTSSSASVPGHGKSISATPAAPAEVSDSPESSNAAETNTTANSTPTPPRPTTAAGILAAAFYSVTGSFLGNKEYQLAVPVTAHMSITTRTGDFDPLKLADAMEDFAKRISGATAPV